jgi:predicted dehydrogenase
MTAATIASDHSTDLAGERRGPVGTALIGYGYWGRNLARNIDVAAGLELVTVAESDPKALAAAGRALPRAKLVSGIDEVLDDPRIEAVVIATPAVRHADLAVAALSAGRHVLVEKPLATSVEDCELMVKTAAKADRTLMVGHTFLYSAPVRRLRSYIDDGELGIVRYLYSQRLSLGRIRRDCNALWNFGPHDISIMMYLLDDRPVEVSARSYSFISSGVDDVCFASLTFGSGIVGNFQCSWIDPRKVRLVTVVGDRKMAVYDDVSPDQKLQLADAGVAQRGNRGFGEFESLGEFQWRTRVGDLLIPHIELVEPLLMEVESFGVACRSGDAPATDGRHGADVVRVLTALDESAARRGAPVEVPW